MHPVKCGACLKNLWEDKNKVEVRKRRPDDNCCRYPGHFFLSMYVPETWFWVPFYYILKEGSSIYDIAGKQQ